MRIGPFGEDDDEDEDGFTEAYDAQIGRVDLVHKAASGQTFVLMKSEAGSGLLDPSIVRDLLKLTPKVESTMAVPKMIKYTRGGHTVTSARQLTKGQLADAIVKAKAKQSAQVAVFDSAGNLVGTVDADAITPLAPAVDPAPPKKAPADVAAGKVAAAVTAPAPAAPEDATDGPVAAAAEDIKKALQGVQWPGGGQQAFTKAEGTIDARFSALIKSLGNGEAGLLKDAVARASLRFIYGRRGGISEAESVRLAKSMALDFGAAQARKPKPGIESGLAAIRKAHERPLR
jgi:hypothetical protein